MATPFRPQKMNFDAINSGNRFEPGDGVTSNAINAPIEAVRWVQYLVENVPDVSEAGDIGTPTVSIILNAEGLPQFKFSNLRGQPGNEFSLNLQDGEGEGSLQQKSTKALAKGKNAVALGGAAENHPTIATQASEENAFAAGASAQANGYASTAVNRKTQALQYGCFAGGGGSVAGRTLEEFRAWVKSYTDKGTRVGTVTSFRGVASYESDRTYCYDSSLGYQDQYYVLFDGYGNVHYDYKRFETYAIAIGEQVEAVARASAAFNRSSHALAEACFAANAAKVEAFRAAGFNMAVIKSGANNSFGAGACTLSAEYTAGFGVNNVVSASAYAGFAAGQGNTVSNTHSTAFGLNNEVAGKGCLVGGTSVKIGTGASWTFAWGYDLIVNGWGQAAVGFRNVNDLNNVFEVGNGNGKAGDPKERANAFAVLADGRAKVQAAPKDDDDVVRKLEIKSFVTSEALKGYATSESIKDLVSKDNIKITDTDLDEMFA